ncbi:BspA family leucine-rich repeat surface protein [Bernardetia sp. OM2101]|uniref:BspA family leucine-rich repeat surface protein n=1 Tax=Bernardetia sp. OM2101 TaxID=3344876 RepID=UPI0035CF5145
MILFFLTTNTTYSQAFRTTWKTTDSTITIRTNDKLDYDYDITWKNLTNKGVGDGSAQNQKDNCIITNLENGSIYEIAITRIFPRFYMDSFKPNFKLQTLEEWGEIEWQSMANTFRGCENLVYNATDIPNLENVTDMSAMFSECKNFKGNATLNDWNIENVTNMWGMFYEAVLFNQPIGKWNTKNVKDMNLMFSGASSFNQPLDQWDTQSVTDMSFMFSHATSFNQYIGKWNTKNVKDMALMFSDAISFNQPIENWNTENVTNMHGMFSNALSFNQPIGKWNTKNVRDTHEMFKSAISFDQSLGAWNISNIVPYEERNEIGFRIVGQGDSMMDMLDSCGMSQKNYDATLLGWATIKKGEKIPKTVRIDAEGLKYCKSKKARKKLISKYNWQIKGDELSCEED